MRRNVFPLRGWPSCTTCFTSICKLRRHVATHPPHAPPARLRGHDAVSPENPRTPRRSLGTIVWRESLRVFTPHEKETDEPVRPCPGAMAPPVAMFPWLPGHARTAVRLCSPIPCAVGALHGVSPPPTHGGLRPGNGARSAARTLRIFFRTDSATPRIIPASWNPSTPPCLLTDPRQAYDGTHFGR